MVGAFMIGPLGGTGETQARTGFTCPIIPLDWSGMERVVHKARKFTDADDWDIRQHVSMTPA